MQMLCMINRRKLTTEEKINKILDNEITMKFEKGTKVTDIIENVILFSRIRTKHW